MLATDRQGDAQETKSECEKALLGSVGVVVHEKHLNVPGILDNEDLVARRDHMLGLLVAAETDLYHAK